MTNNNTFKIALLIQGPLKSVGRSGYTSSVDINHLSSNDIVSYDCRKCISSSIEKYGYLFDQIILSTWNDEILEFNDQSIEVYKFSKSKIPKLKDRKWIKNIHVSKNNMLLQFYGCMYGLEKIKKNINYVVRIRSDQKVNLKYIYEFLKLNKEEDKIYVPKFLKKGPYFEDFYFAGSKNIIMKFIKSSISKDNKGDIIYSDSPHIHSLLKFAYFAERKYLTFDQKYFKKYGYRSLEQFIILFHVFNKYFKALPPKILKSVVWRGAKFIPTASWISNNTEKLNFNYSDYYDDNLWKSTKKTTPKLKKILRKTYNLIMRRNS